MLYSWFLRIWNHKIMLIIHFLHWLKWWHFFPEIACIKLRLYVLLELLLESTCKITWAKGRVNHISQYYFLYSLLVFFLEANFCSLHSNNSWYNCPTLIQGRDKELHLSLHFCFVFVPFIWVFTEIVAFWEFQLDSKFSIPLPFLYQLQDWSPVLLW